jgi:PTH1 family peptidyl-tRNA hydrolase
MGFMVLDAWAQASNAVFSSDRYGSITEISFKGRTFTLLKPSTYMNLSGNAVRYWVNKMKLPLENVLVVCDDLNLPFGKIRMRKNGSAGGHNGLKNIEELLGTQNYFRIRIGIGNGFSRGEQVDFVVGELSENELQEVSKISEKVIAAIKDFATIGPDRAMNIANKKAENPE